MPAACTPTRRRACLPPKVLVSHKPSVCTCGAPPNCHITTVKAFFYVVFVVRCAPILSILFAVEPYCYFVGPPAARQQAATPQVSRSPADCQQAASKPPATEQIAKIAKCLEMIGNRIRKNTVRCSTRSLCLARVNPMNYIMSHPTISYQVDSNFKRNSYVSIIFNMFH